jgi:hypothetical protein
MNFKFKSIGTTKVSVGMCVKMGSSSLDRVHKLYVDPKSDDIIQHPGIIEEMDTHIKDMGDKIYVVLIRDVIDKWKSGYKQELEAFFLIPDYNQIEERTWLWKKSIENIMSCPFCVPELKRFWQRLIRGYYTTFTNPDKVTLVGLNLFSIIHDCYSKLSIKGQDIFYWMSNHHAEFWKWNNTETWIPTNEYYNRVEKELNIYTQLPNIYFLDLKDLNNPKFLEWLQKRDEKWKAVEEIPIRNKTPSKYWAQMNLLWKEYNEGKIFKDRTLACPFYDLPGNKLVPDIRSTSRPGFEVLHKRVKQQQEMVDYIRNNHERYIKL